MNNQFESNNNSSSLLKKITIFSSLLTSLIGGILLLALAQQNLKNYENPILFSLLFGALGLGLGIPVSQKIKPYIIFNSKMEFFYHRETISISILFIGSCIYFGQLLNTNLSRMENCNKFIIVDKQIKKGNTKGLEEYILFLNIENKIQHLKCEENYWKNINKGQLAQVCIYKSPLGFNYFIIMENN